MSASDEEIQSAAEDAQLDSFSRGAVKRYRIGGGGREVETHNPKDIVEAAMLQRALNSPKRGMNLGQIDRPA